MTRLGKARLSHDALQAFLVIRREMHEAKMWIIGDGCFRKNLNQLRGKMLRSMGIFRMKENMSY
jgi:hypothetical protein